MLPVLWSFRRCPYAIRARLALDYAGVTVEHREIVLRDKPAAFLEANPEGTVPVLVLPGRTLIHSRDIMDWALLQNDPEDWQRVDDKAMQLLLDTEGTFKQNLDAYKYASRHPETDALVARAAAAAHIQELDKRLRISGGWLTGQPSLADFAILPFVRQFAHVDREWFYAQPWDAAIDWLDRFKSSDRFARVMKKFPLWQPAAAA